MKLPCQTCNDTGVLIADGGSIVAFQKCPDCDRTEETERRRRWLLEQVEEYERRRWDEGA